MAKFYDTNALLKLKEKVFEDGMFYVSSVTLRELEEIKVNRNKTEQVRYDARKVARMLDDNFGKYQIILDSDAVPLLSQYGLAVTPDNSICACVKLVKDIMDARVVFVTDDICCKVIAKCVLGLSVQSVNELKLEEGYKGFKEMTLMEEEIAYFYQNLDKNVWDLLPNEYLIVHNQDEEIAVKMRWDGQCHQPVIYPCLSSAFLGTIKPYNGDVYQQMALDSMEHNQITMLKGCAGTGKSYLALGFLFYLLEKKRINKIIVFCNTIATINAAKLGYYPGTKDEKLMDSAIGNMLSAKLGGFFAVERLIEDDKLVLLPMSDVRGFDTAGMKAGVYITEAQNMDISLMKLALQRIGEDSMCIVDGDYAAQVDLDQYAGSNNGMRRMSEVFRGQDFYGEVELQNIYRSKIAAVAENM